MYNVNLRKNEGIYGKIFSVAIFRIYRKISLARNKNIYNISPSAQGINSIKKTAHA